MAMMAAKVAVVNEAREGERGQVCLESRLDALHPARSHYEKLQWNSDALASENKLCQLLFHEGNLKWFV